MRIEIPELSVVALVGVSGSGKSTFAAKHFKPTEVLSSDYFRGLISDDENNQAVSAAAFETLHFVANKRLDLGLLTVIDATNVQKEARASVLALAKEQNCLAAAIVLDLPEPVCKARNERRPDRSFGPHVIARQSQQLRRSIKHLEKEGFRYVYVLRSEAEIAEAEIVRMPLWNNKRHLKGPFDIIGDVHGCFDELCALLARLGYTVDAEGFQATPPKGRTAVFLGDLCDRGPKNAQVLRLVMNMAKEGAAYCVAGNHDAKLAKYLKGKTASLTHGLAATVEQLHKEPPEFVKEAKAFVDGLISHYVFDDGRLVVAHAGLTEKYQGRGSGRVRQFCLYGDTTGETDEYGLPVRLPWANEYRGKATVVYGHTPVPEVQEVNRAICIDTGCVFGGRLTAYRYPERETVQVDALRAWYEPVRPFQEPQATAAPDELLRIEDVIGKRSLTTRLRRSITVGAEHSAAALEVMSRFAADPRWLIYLPPTMSPCETSRLPDVLEHPGEAFHYYKSRGVAKVVCEEKHMGSRAVIVLCQNAQVAASRFGITDGSDGILYTRTGRRFFDDKALEDALLHRLRESLTVSGFFEDFQTDWVCLDAELMPWSAKARELIREQYAPVSRAGRSGLSACTGALSRAKEQLKKHDASAEAQGAQGTDIAALLRSYEERAEALQWYTEAYRRYCWEVNSIEDYRIAPFHLLAAEGKVFSGENHLWHMQTIARYMIGADPVLMATRHLSVDLLNEQSIAEGIQWWESLTGAGGEGMVVKPLDFIARHGAEILQPAVKCRGREYLRIIYGPEYLLGDHLQRLKKRSLAKKRTLALNEFALGMESLERFVKKEPLHRVHECVFAVLAMESEPVDPRL